LLVIKFERNVTRIVDFENIMSLIFFPLLHHFFSSFSPDKAAIIGFERKAHLVKHIRKSKCETMSLCFTMMCPSHFCRVRVKNPSSQSRVRVI